MAAELGSALPQLVMFTFSAREELFLLYIFFTPLFDLINKTSLCLTLIIDAWTMETKWKFLCHSVSVENMMDIVIGTSVRRSSGRRSGGRLLAMS